MSSDSIKCALEPQFYDQGQRLAFKAETASIEAVNGELASFRGCHTAAEYNALISSIQSANGEHVAADRTKVCTGEATALTVPTLILTDSPDDADSLPDHIAARVVESPNMRRNEDILPDRGQVMEFLRSRPMQEDEDADAVYGALRS